jgi:branched-subunit amino acid ABC-type transport system permease component
MAALHYFIKAKIDTAMLASVEDKEVAQLQGINAHRIFWVTMAVGCGLCISRAPSSFRCFLSPTACG